MIDLWTVFRALPSDEILRRVLPRNAQIERPKDGKPFTPNGPKFNLSHTDGCIVCATSEDQEVGVDVEPLSKGALFVEQQAALFSPEERAGLSPRKAVELWTSKEAIFKARGTGINTKPSRVTVTAQGFHISIHELQGFLIAVATEMPHEVRVRAL